MLIVGGSGNNKGAILGAVLMWAVWTVSGSAAQFMLPLDLQVKGGAAQTILIGLVLLLTLIFRPLGLTGDEAGVSRGDTAGEDKQVSQVGRAAGRDRVGKYV